MDGSGALEMSNLIGKLASQNDSIYPFDIMTATGTNCTALKFSDGTLICYGTVEIAGSTTSRSSKTGITFPVSYKSSDYSISYMQSYRTRSAENAFQYTDITTNGFAIERYLQEYNQISIGGYPQTCKWITFGRWK